MLNKLEQIRAEKAKTGQKGFTIIEVMIVLAIAGLILVVVLLAVPALQRNARNTGIKSDANSIGGGIGTIVADNSGSPITNVAAAVGSGLATFTDNGKTETIKIQSGTTVTSKTGTYPNGSASGTSLTDPTVANVVVYIGYNCSNAPNTRANAIVYDIETSGGVTTNCIDS